MVQQISESSWVVHRQYGIGQIHGTEVKQISGEEDTYYRLELANGTMWVPVDKLTDDLFRPVVSKDEIEEIKKILSAPPKKMSTNFKVRRARIKQVEMGDSLADLALLVRDLWARHRRRTLSNTELSALRRVTDRLVTEWAVCMGKDTEVVRSYLDRMLLQALA